MKFDKIQENIYNKYKDLIPNNYKEKEELPKKCTLYGEYECEKPEVIGILKQYGLISEEKMVPIFPGVYIKNPEIKTKVYLEYDQTLYRDKIYYNKKEIKKGILPIKISKVLNKIREAFGTNTYAKIYIEVYWEDRPLDYIFALPSLGAAIAECAIKASEDEFNDIQTMRYYAQYFSVRSPHCFGKTVTASLPYKDTNYIIDVQDNINLGIKSFPIIGRKIHAEEQIHKDIVNSRTYEGWNKAKEILFGKVLQQIQNNNTGYICRICEDEFLSLNYTLLIRNAIVRTICLEEEYIKALKQLSELRSSGNICALNCEIEPILSIIYDKRHYPNIKEKINSILWEINQEAK